MKIPIKKIKTANEPLFDNDKKHKSHKRKSKALNFFAIVFLIIYLIAAIIINGTFIYLSILPLKYLIILTAVSTFFFFLFIFLIFRKKSKKPTKIIAIILEILLSTTFVIVFFYLNQTMNFMDAIKSSGYQIDNYSILVKKNSKFETIEDLHYGTIATYDDNSQSYNSALNQLSDKIKFKKIEKENFKSAVIAITNDEVDSLLIKDSLIDLASEVFADFKPEDYRKLYTITIRTPIKYASDYNIDVSKDSFNIYVSGIDTKGDISTVSRSDVNMIVTVNPHTHKILLTSIPRDYYVQLHDTTGLKDKLTHSGLYGVNTTIKTVEDFLGININYYVRVNFDSMVNLIDALGGIDITPDAYFFRPTLGGEEVCYFYPGYTAHLDGACALVYARERKTYSAGDIHRIQNQQDILTAIIDKLTSSRTILTNYTKILSSLSNSLETNIPTSEIYKLVNSQLDSMPSWTIEKISLSGTHLDAPTYTISTEYLYVFEPNEDSISEAKAKIEEVMAEK